MSDDKPKHPGGRPRKYESPEQMQEAIDSYFATCKADEQIPTVTGLALALGFAERKSLIDYCEWGEYLHTVTAAKTFIESQVEQRLLSGMPAAGLVFWLKNYGWRDKTETEHSGHMQFSDMSEEAINRRLAELMAQQ